jgi:hypothetical protein
MRSGYEDKIAGHLDAAGIPYTYEPLTFGLKIREVGRQCLMCTSKDIVKASKYTPDFCLGSSLTNDMLFVEAKGRLTSKERKIILAFRDQIAAPQGFGYAVLIQRDNWMTKTHTQRYSDWLRKNNIPYAVGEKIPEAWLKGDFRANP